MLVNATTRTAAGQRFINMKLFCAWGPRLWDKCPKAIPEMLYGSFCCVNILLSLNEFPLNPGQEDSFDDSHATPVGRGSSRQGAPERIYYDVYIFSSSLTVPSIPPWAGLIWRFYQLKKKVPECYSFLRDWTSWRMILVYRNSLYNNEDTHFPPQQPNSKLEKWNVQKKCWLVLKVFILFV